MSLKDFEKHTPHFCIIAPNAYLEEYATQSPAHLVLAHIVDKDPVYADFYRSMSDRGDRVIMDNGAFELGQSFSPEKLIKLGHLCGADAIVLPDYPGKSSEVTITAAEKWIPSFKDEGFRTMFVPQSEIGNIDDWIDCYIYAADHPNIDIIGMSILGMPNAIPHIPRSYARVVLTEILRDRGVFADWKYHHYLGLNSGPALELPTLIQMNALDSCDSSNPVWMAILGHEYTRNSDSYLSTRKIKKEVEFDFPWIKDNDTHRRIQHNIDLTLELFQK